MKIMTMHGDDDDGEYSADMKMLATMMPMLLLMMMMMTTTTTMMISTRQPAYVSDVSVCWVQTLVSRAAL